MFEAIDAAREKISLQKTSEEPSIYIKSKGTLSKIFTKDIILAEIYNRTITLYTTTGEYQYYGKMSELLSELGEMFFKPGENDCGYRRGHFVHLLFSVHGTFLCKAVPSFFIREKEKGHGGRRSLCFVYALQYNVSL